MRFLRTSGRFASTSSLLLAALVLAACGTGGSQNSSAVSGDRDLVKSFGENENTFTAYGEDATKRVASVDTTKVTSFLKSLVRRPTKFQAKATPKAVQENSMVLGFPAQLIGQNYLFGSVITGVSDKTSERLGRLKMTDLTPLHATAEVMQTTDGKYMFVLVGCIAKCGEGSDLNVLVATPVVGADVDKKEILVDLAPLGAKLNLIEMLDPTGQYTQLKTKSSSTVRFEYSLNTLVFDIDVVMEPMAIGPQAATPDVTFTSRWYLKLASSFRPSFTTRTPTDGVGYFTTERSQTTRINRWALGQGLKGDPSSLSTVHYYIKSVPKEFQGAFQAAFDDWNRLFVKTIGKKLLSYEFLADTDPKFKTIVAGDVRYNVMEWDLHNRAPYGGLGPSVANQHTGELFSANVLIQGPAVIEIYNQWWKINEAARELRKQGNESGAEQILREGSRKLQAKMTAQEKVQSRVALNLNGNLEFRVPSQLPALEDPIAQRIDFDEVPAGFTYEAYMNGYFREMVAHELGHNLGLRHNFRGNLAATGKMNEGEVSGSVMEYLNKNFRHLNRLGAYDEIAIAYGYAGKAPADRTLFCTDEDAVDENSPFASAECSRDDATPDPFGYFAGRLEKAINKLVVPTSTAAPEWSLPDMKREVVAAYAGLLQYVSSAATSKSWKRFFQYPGRPTTADGVKGFVLAQIHGQVCAKKLDDAAAAKATETGKQKAIDNVTALREFTATALAAGGLFSDEEAKCPAAAGPML